MKNDLRFCVLREEAGDAPAGGGGSHEAAADALFAEKPAATGEKAAPPAGKAEGNPPAAPAKAEAPKPDTSLFGKIARKPEPGAAAKPPGAAPAADLPEDKLTLGDKASAETKTQFSVLKDVTKKLRGEVATSQARIKELEAKAAAPAQLPPDYEKLKAEHKAFSDRVAVLDVQHHPEFIAQFTEPKAKLVAEINTVLADNRIEGADMAALLAKPRADFMKAANELAEKLPDYDRFTFMAGARQLHQIAQAEHAALGKAGELAKAFQAKTLATQRETFAKTWDKLGGMEEFLVKLEAKDDASPEEKAAIAAYNEGLAAVRANAEKLAFAPGGEEGVAQTAAKAASFDFFVQHAVPQLEKEFRTVVEINRALAEEVKALRGAKGEGINGTGGGGEKPENLTHEQAAAAVWGKS